MARFLELVEQQIENNIDVASASNLFTRAHLMKLTTWRPPAEVENAIQNLAYLEKLSIGLLRKEGRKAPATLFGRRREIMSRRLYSKPVSELDKTSDEALRRLRESVEFLDPRRPVRPPGAAAWQSHRELVHVQYDTLLNVACEVEPRGNWTIIIGGLMGNLDHSDLISRAIPTLVTDHPMNSVVHYDLINVADLQDRFLRAANGLESKKERLQRAGAGKERAGGREIFALIVAIAKVIYKIAQYYQDMKTWKEREEARIAQERAEAERQLWEKFNRGERLPSMKGAENHVDSFDNNRGWIERTC